MRSVLVFSLVLLTPFVLIIDARYWLPMYKKDTPYCMKRLLRSEGFHPGRHIKVSSEHDDFGDRRRVVKDGDPWCTSSGNRFGEWVQVDLGSTKLISGVLIKGWKWDSSNTSPDVEWNSRVTHYSVEFSPDGRLWTVIKDENGRPRHFHSVREHKSVRKNEYEARAGYQSFDPFLHARFFRLRIHAWRRHQCLSMELYGCESHWAMGNIQLMQPQRAISIADCHYVNPIEVHYWQLTLNSARYQKYYGINRRGSERKWCVERSDRNGPPPWLEFDLLYRRFISRIEVSLFQGKLGKARQHLDTRTVRFSEDGKFWIGFHFNKKTPSGKISYASRPVAARYVRIPTVNFPAFFRTCVRLNLFGCSDEVQSIGLWSNQGRVRMSWATIHGVQSKRDALRLIEPGQKLYCTRATSAKVYFRIDLINLFAITRIVFIGETKRTGPTLRRGPALKCVRDESRKLLSLFSSLDGRLWTPFGIYNQVHGDKIRQAFQLDYENEFQCAAILDIRPTIYGQKFWIREETESRYIDCVAMEIFGNQAEKPLPSQGKRKPGCAAPLGMESRKIRDKQIKASTHSTGINMKARNARLNSNGGWCVKTLENYAVKKEIYNLPSDFLEIDLLSEKYIDGFATQGHGNRGLNRFVRGYIVHYSNDGFSWDVISSEERERYFVANKNTRETVRQYLNPRIRARYLRFVPVTWYKWICMRVEVYGCDAGDSLQDKLEKKLLEINKERVEYVLTIPGTMKNRYREAVNIYYQRHVIACGTPPKYDFMWQNQHYLWKILDLRQCVWLQETFNNEFNASRLNRLFLDERRTLKTRSGKHFICRAKLEDGTEIYRHHVITAKFGVKAPTEYDSDPWIHVGSRGLFTPTLEIPQIIVQQRVDQGYDGGKPVWGKPAVVYASGSVASIGVLVFGIPYFMVALPRSYIKDRGWSMSYMGPVVNDTRRYVRCARLALMKGFDHFSWNEGDCYSSYAMPANVYKMDDDRGKNHQSSMEHREFVRPFFIKGMRKFDKYQIKWSKFDQTSKKWILIFSYEVNDPQRQTSVLFTMKPDRDNDYFKYSRSRARGRYRAYDKAYFGNYFTGSHVLDIERVTAADLGTYKVEVFNLVRSVGNEAIIELRHEDEPRISLPETFGACMKTPLKLDVTMAESNFQYPSPWSVNWYHVRTRKSRRHRTLKAENSATLTVVNPLPEQTGQLYEVDVRNSFGLARGVTRILVTEDVPFITWVTPSPHLAAKDVSDLLEVKFENDKTLVTVDWYHNGTLIDRTTDGFTFPGEKYGSSSFRKKLKLARISFDTSGTYRIVARGKYCQFEETVEVQVLIRPRLIAEPHAVYKRVNEGENEIRMNVTVKGGHPKPRREDMGWKKSGKPLSPSRYGRVILYTTLTKQEDWFTAIVIKDLKETDSGDYTFTVKTGLAVTTVTRSLLVLSRQDYNYNTTTESWILEFHTTSPTSSSVCYSFTIVLLYFPCLLTGIAYKFYQ